eukprot:5511275-Pyramimonas_sp.AAC.1
MTGVQRNLPRSPTILNRRQHAAAAQYMIDMRKPCCRDVGAHGVDPDVPACDLHAIWAIEDMHLPKPSRTNDMFPPATA